MNEARLAAAAKMLLREEAGRANIDPFIVMDVMQKAQDLEASGKQVIHMEVGQPATGAPRAALERVKAALDSDPLGYTMALGIDPLRERNAHHYKDLYGVDISADRVVVTTGSSGAFLLSFLGLFNAGDKVALPAPGYPCYRNILSAVDVETVPMVTGPDTRWMPTLQQVETAATQDKVAGVLIASPSNPTGTMFEPARLKEIALACRRLGIWFISDEIYDGLAWGQEQASALQYSDEAIVINSFSKYFSMTGWRVGWMIVPEGLARTIQRLAQNIFISAPTVSQVAALGAFDGMDELEQNKRVYATNRELLLRELPKAGFTDIVPADGAFYLYADVSRFTNDSGAFTWTMLDETGVAVTPGLDFDPERGSRYIRFSYAGSTDDMAEGVHRLQNWQRLQA
ncbi:MAG: pyridoxal phosphate-dependent aminotransferase [Hyphomicrobiaceae bacterium]